MDAGERRLTRRYAAASNDAPGLEPPGPLGRALASFISDSTTPQIYEDLLKRVREQGRALVFPIRCDAPSVRRFLSITIGPGDGYSVSSRLVRSEQRAPVSLTAGEIDPSAEHIRSCGWCKRIDVDQQWLEIEEAITRLARFDNARLPQVSHGICDGCLETMERTLGVA